MVNPVSSAPPRRIVVRANRETLTLVLAACAVTFALSCTIHARPPETSGTEVVEIQDNQQDWAGQLADLTTDSTTAAVEPMTSASLVVPKSALALPTPARKPHPCDTACAAKSPRAKLSHFDAVEREAERDRSMLSKLNPLNHLPDMTTLGKPFAIAGNTISGWIGRL